jgi:rifampicin phosphotransferase
MKEIRIFGEIGPADCDSVGGKALSLGVMTAAGLPVPAGFCVTTAAYRRLGGQALREDAELTRAITEKVRELGNTAVAVRSSATAEDGTVTSFAGQHETILGVSGEAQILDAIAKCWASLGSERAMAYRKHLGVEGSPITMAVIVQKLVPSEVAGVLFTRDPLDPSGRRMLVEASLGLGETVVSGCVAPDRFHLDRETGKILEQHICTKSTMQTPAGPQPVPPDKQSIACLDEEQLRQLAELGRKVEACFGSPRDVEWAWAEGRFWLLQARFISAPDAGERTQVRRQEIEALAARVHPHGTVWSRYNLAEILPEPTPMTWAIIRHFMSGQGGYGLMYRDLGFDPDPALNDTGIFDLVCGRPYCNLSREPLMQSRSLPFEHSFAVLKSNPQKALYPQAVLNPARAGWRFWLFLPWIVIKLFRAAVRLRSMSRTFALQFQGQILPAFLISIQELSNQDFSKIESGVLLNLFRYLTRLVLVDFARDSLKPTVLAMVAMANLKRPLLRALGKDRTRSALAELAVGARPAPDADLAAAIDSLQNGEMDRTLFMKQFGHRAGQEMELAQPRWEEDLASVNRLLASVPSSASAVLVDSRKIEKMRDRIAAEAKLTARQRTALDSDFERLHVYLGLRETAKHYLMKGYALIRRVLVELDRRHNLKGGIFYLVPEELPSLLSDKDDFIPLIQQRRRRRAVALSLEVPAVIFSDDLEAIGRPTEFIGADNFQGVPLSGGVAEAPALVVREPSLNSVPAQPYILVCPSTDPAWVPLVANARGLIMETGGVLSHGAIVAREFNLPAVAGLPDILRRIQNGRSIHLNGNTGKVTLL